MHKVMSAGPTMVQRNVMEARSQEFTNPDLDFQFFDFYRDTCRILSEAANTKNEAFILGGEGILGLEAACAAFTEPGDRVLVIDNGIFGRGFDGFATMYGGAPIYFESDYRKPVDVDALKAFLEKDHDFKYATLVHCDTPSGVLNDMATICNMLKEYGILTVVDTVSGIFGEYVNMDKSGVDFLCGGSQKALSAPPGLTMVWLSDDAWTAIDNRKTPIPAFYANISLFRNYYENEEFPYTMPVSDIMGFRVALDNFMEDKDVLGRHRKIAMAVRGALRNGNLKLYLEEGWANTVTAIELPEGIEPQKLMDIMKDKYGVLISGSLGCLQDTVVRIGHMGTNATVENVEFTLNALQKALEDLGFEFDGDMANHFRRLMV